MDRSKSLNSNLRGPSHSMSIFASFQGLHEFLKNAIQDHRILGAIEWGTYAPSAE